jgi:hypothetical protein
MGIFLKCLCNEDYHSLIIEGNASDQELAEAWVLLLSEYQELKGESVNNIEHVRLSKKITRVRSHLQLVDVCTKYLSEKYSESIADSLRKLGYSFNPKEKDPETYIHLLNQIINKTKLKYVQLQQMVKQLNDLLIKEMPIKPSRESFESTLIQIEEMQKTSYDLDHITVMKYVMLEKKLIRQLELIQSKAQWQPNV